MVFWEDFFAALSLVFVIEGLFLFISPTRWRDYVKMICGQSPRALRLFGAVSMAVGMLALYVVRHWY